MNSKQKQVINAKTLQRSIKKYKPKINQKNATQEETAQTANDYAVGKVAGYADNTKSAALKTADFAVDSGKKGVRYGMEKRAVQQAKRSVMAAKTPHKVGEHTQTNSSLTGTDTKTTPISRAGRGANTSAKTTTKSARTSARIKNTVRSVRTSSSVKTAANSARAGAKGTAKTVQTTAKAAQSSAKAAQAAAKAAARSAKVAAKATAKTVSTTVKVTIKAVGLAAKAAVLALKGLIAVIVLGGWTAVLVIILVCLLAFILSSGFGIFYADEPSDANAVPITRVMSDISYDFYAEIDRLQEQHSADRVEMQGERAIDWKELLTVFSVKSSSEGSPIAQMTPENVSLLQAVFDDTVSLTYEVEVVEIEPPPEEEQPNSDDESEGNESEDEENREEPPVTETVLIITIEQKPYTEMMSVYGFDSDQTELVELLLSDQFDGIWAEVLGGFMQGSGQIIVSDADVIPTGRFSYPLPDTFTITSYFGWRENPFTGEEEFHNAIDISAPQGTPILAADDGVVTVANGTDSWGGSYGYYVKIRHSDGYETLYAHCFAIAVTQGQTVQKGEVIAYVGTTGSSTGDHVHFEVAKDGTDVDPLSFFRQ